MDTAQRMAAVQARLQEIQVSEDAAARAAPSCAKCIFGPLNDTGEGKCDHLVHWQRRHDPVLGKWKGRLEVTTSEARSPNGLCGPEGLLFQPYTLPRTAARWFHKHGPFPLWYGLIGIIGGAAALIESLAE